MGEFLTVMQTLYFILGLHNGFEISHPLSCLYQAMQTWKTFYIDSIDFHTCPAQKGNKSPCKQSPPVAFFKEEEKRRICLNCIKNLRSPQPKHPRLVNLVFSRQTGFFECEHPFIDKPVVITEPAEASAQLLQLGVRVQNCILTTCSACFTEIVLDS